MVVAAVLCSVVDVAVELVSVSVTVGVVKAVVVADVVVGAAVVLFDFVTNIYGVGVGGRIMQSSGYTHLRVTSSRIMLLGQ